MGRFFSVYCGFPCRCHFNNAQCSKIILSLPSLHKFGNSQRRKIETLLSRRYGATGEGMQFVVVVVVVVVVVIEKHASAVRL